MEIWLYIEWNDHYYVLLLELVEIVLAMTIDDLMNFLVFERLAP